MSAFIASVVQMIIKYIFFIFIAGTGIVLGKKFRMKKNLSATVSAADKDNK